MITSENLPVSASTYEAWETAFAQGDVEMPFAWDPQERPLPMKEIPPDELAPRYARVVGCVPPEAIRATRRSIEQGEYLTRDGNEYISVPVDEGWLLTADFEKWSAIVAKITQRVPKQLLSEYIRNAGILTANELRAYIDKTATDATLASKASSEGQDELVSQFLDLYRAFEDVGGTIRMLEGDRITFHAKTAKEVCAIAKGLDEKLTEKKKGEFANMRMRVGIARIDGTADDGAVHIQRNTVCYTGNAWKHVAIAEAQADFGKPAIYIRNENERAQIEQAIGREFSVVASPDDTYTVGSLDISSLPTSPAESRETPRTVNPSQDTQEQMVQTFYHLTEPRKPVENTPGTQAFLWISGNTLQDGTKISELYKEYFRIVDKYKLKPISGTCQDKSGALALLYYQDEGVTVVNGHSKQRHLDAAAAMALASQEILAACRTLRLDANVGLVSGILTLADFGGARYFHRSSIGQKTTMTARFATYKTGKDAYPYGQMRIDEETRTKLGAAGFDIQGESVQGKNKTNTIHYTKVDRLKRTAQSERIMELGTVEEMESFIRKWWKNHGRHSPNVQLHINTRLRELLQTNGDPQETLSDSRKEVLQRMLYAVDQAMQQAADRGIPLVLPDIDQSLFHIAATSRFAHEEWQRIRQDLSHEELQIAHIVTTIMASRLGMVARETTLAGVLAAENIHVDSLHAMLESLQHKHLVRLLQDKDGTYKISLTPSIIPSYHDIARSKTWTEEIRSHVHRQIALLLDKEYQKYIYSGENIYVDDTTRGVLGSLLFHANAGDDHTHSARIAEATPAWQELHERIVGQYFTTMMEYAWDHAHLIDFIWYAQRFEEWQKDAMSQTSAESKQKRIPWILKRARAQLMIGDHYLAQTTLKLIPQTVDADDTFSKEARILNIAAAAKSYTGEEQEDHADEGPLVVSITSLSDIVGEILSKQTTVSTEDIARAAQALHVVGDLMLRLSKADMHHLRQAKTIKAVTSQASYVQRYIHNIVDMSHRTAHPTAAQRTMLIPLMQVTHCIRNLERNHMMVTGTPNPTINHQTTERMLEVFDFDIRPGPYTHWEYAYMRKQLLVGILSDAIAGRNAIRWQDTHWWKKLSIGVDDIVDVHLRAAIESVSLRASHHQGHMGKKQLRSMRIRTLALQRIYSYVDPYLARTTEVV